MSEIPPNMVWVIDDETVIAATLVAILKMNGFRAMAFNDAESAIEAAKFDCPDILVSDVMMPGINGIDLAILFKSTHPICKSLLMSGNTATHELSESAKRNGHTFALLAKPFHPMDFLAAVGKL